MTKTTFDEKLKEVIAGVRKHRKLMTGLALILGFIIVMFLITNRYTYIVEPKSGHVYKIDKITGKTWMFYYSKMVEVKEERDPSPGLFSRFSTFIQEIGQELGYIGQEIAYFVQPQSHEQKEQVQEQTEQGTSPRDLITELWEDRPMADADLVRIGEDIMELIQKGEVTENDWKRTPGYRALQAARIARGVEIPFSTDLLEIRNTKLDTVESSSDDVFIVNGSIYNKSESDTATDIVLRMFYYDKDVLVDTRDVMLYESVEPRSTKKFKVFPSDVPTVWYKLDYKIIRAKLSVTKK